MKINKVAVCISGHLREGDKLCYPSLKKYLLDKYDCDIFVSAFKEMGNVQFVSRDDHPIEEIDTTSRILETYKPVSYVMHSADAQWIKNIKNRWGDLRTRNTARVYQVCAMYKNIYEVQHLRKMYEIETGTKYDVVVRARFDTEYLSDVIEESNYGANADLVFKLGHCGVYDQTFWGAPELIDAVAECYLYIPQIVNASNSTSFENAENILTAYLQAREIPFVIKNEIKVSVTKPHGRHVN